MDNKELIMLALKAREKAYAPYSGFRVGAALLSQSGKVYTGCNIENAAFSATVCAERTALFKAVSEGERNFEMIAIAGGREETPEDLCFPCGVCRQALSEFCGGDFLVICAKSEGEFVEKKLSELLPESFGLKN